MKPDCHPNDLPASQPVNTLVRGFTLVDLLVVLIHVGILAAVTVPTFLSQANNAKEAEGRQRIGAMNRSQQAYYLEKRSFAPQPSFTDLGLGFPQTSNNYRYSIRGGGADLSTVVNAASPVQGATAPIRAYIGGVSVVTMSQSPRAVTTAATICEARKPPVMGGDAGVANPAFLATAAPVCPSYWYRPVQPSLPR
jgi:type IV pilus assembly protein PilA